MFPRTLLPPPPGLSIEFIGVENGTGSIELELEFGTLPPQTEYHYRERSGPAAAGSRAFLMHYFSFPSISTCSEDHSVAA